MKKQYGNELNPVRSVWSVVSKVLIYVFLISIALILIFPYVWMLLTSFKDDYEAMSLTLVLFPKEWIFSNYEEIWTIVPFLSGVWNTIKVEVSVIVVGTFVSALAALLRLLQ